MPRSHSVGNSAFMPVVCLSVCLSVCPVPDTKSRTVEHRKEGSPWHVRPVGRDPIQSSKVDSRYKWHQGDFESIN